MDRIIVDARVHFGKPCVAGTRITVQDVLELVDQDLPFDRIIQDYYADLTAADIHACIHWRGAASVRERVERYLDLATDHEPIGANVGSYAFSPVNAIPRTKYF